MSQRTKAHKFASSTSQLTDQSLQKSVLFTDPKRNSNFFSSSLRCFNFFANAQPSTDKQSDSLWQTLIGQCNLTRATEARTANRRLAQWRVTWLIEQLTSHQLLWCIVSFVLLNPQLRRAPKR